MACVRPIRSAVFRETGALVPNKSCVALIPLILYSPTKRISGAPLPWDSRKPQRGAEGISRITSVVMTGGVGAQPRASSSVDFAHQTQESWKSSGLERRFAASRPMSATRPDHLSTDIRAGRERWARVRALGIGPAPGGVGGLARRPSPKLYQYTVTRAR